MTKAICILSKELNNKTYDLAMDLKDKEYDIFVCCDEPTKIKKHEIISIKSSICERAGYKNTVSYCKDRACSREKALYYFKKINKNYKNIWLIEDDVFIPSIQSIKDLDHKYFSEIDLLAPANAICQEKEGEWIHWEKIIPYIGPPYGISMVCAIRISDKLLNAIDNYAKQNKTLFFCEALFNTLALQNNLTTWIASELENILCKPNWETFAEALFKKQMCHPIKNIYFQKMLRLIG